MTSEDAKALVAKHGTVTAAAKAAGVPKSTFYDWTRKGGKTVKVNPATDTAVPVNGVATFSLRNVSLLSKKPQDTLKGRFYQLKRGIGYKIEDLAKAWHISEETLLRRATDHHAKGYIEPTPGEFVCVIVHPETQKERSV
jgi:hypothetical protein